MSHFDITFPGIVINADFKPKLLKLRKYIATIKDNKLESRHIKLKALNRIDAEGNCKEVYDHLLSEYLELGVELQKGSDFYTVLKEVADIINCAEIIGALVMEEHFKGVRLIRLDIDKV